jgi:hypothetical protein
MTDIFYKAKSFSEMQSELVAQLNSFIGTFTGNNSELTNTLTDLISKITVDGILNYEFEVVGEDQYLVNGTTRNLSQLLGDLIDNGDKIRKVVDFFSFLTDFESDFQLWSHDGTQMLGGIFSADEENSSTYFEKISFLMQSALVSEVPVETVSTIKIIDTYDWTGGSLQVAEKSVVKIDEVLSELEMREMVVNPHY